MGLIKQTGFDVKGVLIKPAYTKIMKIEINDDNAKASFGISDRRENLDNGMCLDSIDFFYPINKKEDKIYEELYKAAKDLIFYDWEDDIRTDSRENIENQNLMSI